MPVVVVVPYAEDSHDCKQLHTEGGSAVCVDDISVCHLMAMFSSVCTPASVSFIITSWGVGAQGLTHYFIMGSKQGVIQQGLGFGGN